jgi:hypothetical protein
VTVWSVAAEALLGGPLPAGGASPLDEWSAGVGLAATRGRFIAVVRARAWLPTDDAIAGMSTRMQFSGEGLAASICRIAGRTRISTLAVCATAGAAAIRGASTGGLASTPRTAPWTFAGLGIDQRFHLWRGLHLDLRMEVVASLTRPKFALQPESSPETTTVYTVGWAVPTIGFGLSYDL